MLEIEQNKKLNIHKKECLSHSISTAMNVLIFVVNKTEFRCHIVNVHRSGVPCDFYAKHYKSKNSPKPIWDDDNS